jgi:hypothetical protein
MAKRLEPFDPVAFGPGPADRVIVRPQPWRPGELRRLWRAVRAESLPAQAVIITGAVAVPYLLFVFGLLLGAGLHG